MRGWVIGLLLAGAGGCSDRGAMVEGGTGTGGGTGAGAAVSGPGFTMMLDRNVDVLFVIDDSNNMSEVQRRFSIALDAFFDALEGEHRAINLRIGFTSTDDGHLFCDDDEVDAGQLIASSCLERIEDFSRESTGLVAEETCTDACALETIELSPTRVEGDPVESPRPWIERLEGATNLPPGVSITEAARCFAPLGIRGCGFESHLNSMWKALELSSDENQRQYGFIRPGASLAVVFVTNEAECSSTRALQSTTFGLEGPNTRVFWTLPDQQEVAPSAVCWNAGVDCDFSADTDQCRAVDKLVDGSIVEDHQVETAMERVSKYIEQLFGLEIEKNGRGVVVAGLVGVAPQFQDTGTIEYATGPNPSDPSSFQAMFGIGSGCRSDAIEGVPPVRLRPVAEQFGGEAETPLLFSVCESDYRPALAAIGQAIRTELAPDCVPFCVADDAPETPGLQADCSVSWSSFEGSVADEDVPRCDRGQLPERASVCFEPLAGASMDPNCADEGWNLELVLVFRPGASQYADAYFWAECAPSEDPERDCPGLP